MTRLHGSVAASGHHDRARKIALISLRVVGAIVTLVAVVVGGLLIVLRTSWGGERVRRAIVGRINQQIQGQLGIGRLAFGGDRLVVWDVTLRDPGGQPVARVARAEVDFRVTRLLRKEVRLTAVIIEAPRLAAVSDPRGFNLTRALAPRQPRQEAPPAPRPRRDDEGWVIRLDRFDLEDGDVLLASVDASVPGGRRETVHLGALRSFISARYAIGNRSTDLTFKLEGRSELAPTGPLAIAAEARVRGDAVHFSVDGGLLAGTVKARGDIDMQRLEAADAVVAVAISRQTLAGFDWGPLRIDAEARPGTVPRLDLLLAIPGVELTAKGGGHAGGRDVFKLDGRLALDDLARTVAAARALAIGALPPASGHGVLGFTAEGPMAGAPASWNGAVKGLFDHLRVEENTITDLTIDGRMAHLSKDPGEADLRVAVASVRAGTTRLGDVRVDAKVRRQEITVSAGLAAPEALSLGLAARFDDDRGLALTRVALSYPQAKWTLAPGSVGTARVHFDGQAVSLANLRLESQGQELALEGSKSRDASDEKRGGSAPPAARIAAHLIAKLRLDLLPALIADPALGLGGTLDVDVTAAGRADDPRVTARVRLEQGRFRKLSKIRARLDATLADRRVDGTLGVDAPFAAVDGAFRLPVDPLAPGAPLDVRVDLARLDLGDALRGAGMPPRADGKLTARLLVTSSAADPKIDLTVNGRDLDVRQPATSSPSRPPTSSSPPSSPREIGLGRVAVRLTYQDRSAHADVDFASAHGGTLRVDAGAGIDLGYPRVARKKIVVETLPVHGKVVARDFDMAWVAALGDRVSSMGGRLSADARLAGTVGDPRLVGDVRWKNGKIVVATARKPAAGAKRR